MTSALRRATVSAALTAALSAVLVGCSSSDGDASPEPSQAPSGAVTTTLSATPSAASAPVVRVGQSATFTAVDSATDVPSQMRVTVVSARYVTAKQVGTTTAPQGQFVDIKLTVKNVGNTDGQFSGYGKIKWEDATTAAQDATTLEGLGAGPDVDTDYKPGQAVTGDVVLDVARRGGTLSYWDNLFGDGPSFTITLPAR